MIRLIFILISSILLFNAGSTPARLEKQQTKSKFESFCERIAPYVLLLALALLSILTLVVLVKYGASITGTEANIYYYHNNV